MEYPGYGAYQGKPCEEQIFQDAEIVYDFLTKKLEIEEDNITVMGRSLGTGPATYISSIRSPSNLILVSPFTSIKCVSSELLGGFLSFLVNVKQRFNNQEHIQKVYCPTLILHGKKDDLINYKHSQKLAKKHGAPVQAQLRLMENMRHNNFNMYLEVVNPIFDFWKQSELMESNGPVIVKDCFMNYHYLIDEYSKMKEKFHTLKLVNDTI